MRLTRIIGSDKVEPNTMEISKQTEAIDTVHQPEALRVLGEYAGDETWTCKEEKKLVRKIDRKLLVLLVITYGLQYYDKTILSQAVSWIPHYSSDEADLVRLSLGFLRT
jgi:hypothetical protein